MADAPRYVYMENGSKNRSGGLTQLQVQNKVVPIDAVPEARNRCYVYFCLQKSPPEAFEKPCACIPKDPKRPWFTLIPVGKKYTCKNG